MATFAGSTQHEDWLFTEEDLMKIKQQTNKEAYEFLEKRKSRRIDTKMNDDSTELLSTEMDSNSTNTTTVTSGTSKKRKERTSEPKKKSITIEEEDELKRYYCGKIQTLCGREHLNRSVRIMSTAVAYYKRFFLTHHPNRYEYEANMVFACIFLASKVEDEPISTKEIMAKVKITPKHILATELILLSGLKFQLIVHHPHRALAGFIDQIRENPYGLVCPNIETIQNNSIAIINRIITTDVVFLFSPVQIALVALHTSAMSFGFDFDKFLELSEYKKHQSWKLIEQSLEKIKGHLKLSKTEVTENRAKDIKKVLSRGMHPKNMSSAKAKKKRDEKVAELKRIKLEKEIEEENAQIEQDKELLTRGDDNAPFFIHSAIGKKERGEEEVMAED